MPKPDLVILILNAVFVTVAVALNFRAARHGLIRFRSVHTAACALGCIYIAGYIWLFWQLLYASGDDATQILRWSSTFRGISLIAWPAIWWWTPLESLKVHGELKKAVADALSESES
jgi:hypothetical protein